MVKTDGSLGEMLAALRSAALEEADRSAIIRDLLELAQDLVTAPDPGPSNPAVRATAESMPTPLQQQIALRLYRARGVRNGVFNDDLLFGEPGWDILLDLLASERVGRDVSITSALIAARRPPTTALRWVQVLIARGYIERTDDEADRRRAFLTLSDKARRLLRTYFVELRRKGLL